MVYCTIALCLTHWPVQILCCIWVYTHRKAPAVVAWGSWYVGLLFFCSGIVMVGCLFPELLSKIYVMCNWNQKVLF